MTVSNTYQRWTISFILVLLAFRLVALFLSPLGLHGDEAQYWAWSKELDWGYFTKPPLIAWVIWTTTSLFGDVEWAVRISSPLLHSITAFVIFRTARLAFDAKTGFWAALIYLLMPALWLSSGIVSTDVPLLLCWALAMNAWLHLCEKFTPLKALQLGIAIGFGLLAKYAMFFFFPALILAWVLDTQTRQALRSRQGLMIGLVACLIFLPNIIWNFQHDFATVTHTADNANLSKTDIPFHPDELLQFLGDQLAVFGPVSFVLLGIALIYALRGKLNKNARLMSLFTASPLLIISIEALLSRANANWAVTAYIAGSMLTAHMGVQYGPKFAKWLKGGLIVQSAICLVVAIAFLSPTLTDSLGLANSVKRLRKWPETVTLIEDIYNQGHQGLDYQTVAIDKRIMFYDLTYYGLAKKRPLKMWMQSNTPENHAELTAPLQPQAGPILFLNYHSQPEDVLRADFEKLERLPDINIDLGGGKQRHLRVWAGYGYAPKRNK